MELIRVYRYGLRPPEQNEPLVRDQLRAAHDYRNDLVQIERGRRWATRRLHDTLEVKAAEEAVRQATRSTRIEALKELGKARQRAEREARCEGGRWAVPLDQIDDYPFSPLYELERIKLLEGALVRGARALTTCYWGTYLSIEDAAQKARKAPLYDDSGLNPKDPHFVRWPSDGQVGVQIQSTKPLTTAGAKAGTDSRVRWVRATGRKTYELWLRVGSDGRKPVWAVWPVYLDREMPDVATWSWVRVSRRREGTREQWSCEITLDTKAPHPHTLDSSLEGAIAVELSWWPQDDGSMIAATWLDSRGERGQLRLPARLVTGIRKPDNIRSIRDLHRNELREKLARIIRDSKDALPEWLRRAGATMHLWVAQERFHRLWREWMARRCDACRNGFELLDVWHMRDDHLYDYESGARREALGERRELYRIAAARWSQQYRTVLLPDRDLSREARWGEESDRRFTTAPQELRSALRNAFATEAIDAEWRGAHGVIDDGDENTDAPDWKEMAIEQWRGGKTMGRTRKRKKSTDHLEKGGAWAARKARKMRVEVEKRNTTRNTDGKATE